MSGCLVFYISGHGFGHAARDVEIINALSVRTDVDITVRTDVPEWFLRESLRVPVTRVAGAVDAGMVQPDGISLDEDASAGAAADFYKDFDARTTREAAFIRSVGADLVLGDIPPLASAAAATASVPSVAVGNFTWDWVYGSYPQFASLAPGVIDRIASGYRQTTVALRLPFCGGFATMPRIEDVPLIARMARYSKAETRKRLQFDVEQPLVLASFGGHNGQVELGPLTSNVLTVVSVGDESLNDAARPGLRVLSSDRLRHAGLSYTDLLAASDVVLSKVGYGIVADCIANQVPLLYTHRGRFVEQDVFARELPAVLRCRYVDAAVLREGNWTADVSTLLQQAPPELTVAVNGADVVAARIQQMLER